VKIPLPYPWNDQPTALKAEHFKRLDGWVAPDEALDQLEAMSRKSLDEVKSLTEHQDEKANRILTAIAFLSAFAGLLFQTWKAEDATGLLASSVEISFFLYAVTLVLGALLSIWAIQPQFNVPGREIWNSKDDVGSRLFFLLIVEATPDAWISQFDGLTPKQLQMRYIRDNVRETYLVAEKVGLKIARLDHAVLLLKSSVFMLLVSTVLILWSLCFS